MKAGRLEEKDVADVVQELSTSRATGRLVLEHGERRIAVNVEDGRLVFASSSDPDHRLGPMLLRRGAITLRQMEDAVRGLTPGKRFGIDPRGAGAPRPEGAGARRRRPDARDHPPRVLVDGGRVPPRGRPGAGRGDHAQHLDPAARARGHPDDRRVEPYRARLRLADDALRSGRRRRRPLQAAHARRRPGGSPPRGQGARGTSSRCARTPPSTTSRSAAACGPSGSSASSSACPSRSRSTTTGSSTWSATRAHSPRDTRRTALRRDAP